MGRRAKPAKVKVQAKRLLARKSPDNEGARVRDLEKRLAEALRREAEALEQQTATAEILRVISTSPTNLEPVLDAVVKSATRFCGAPDASVFRLEGEALRADAHHGPVSQPPGFLVPVVRGSVAGRSVLERRAVGVTDLQGESEEFPEGSALARETGQRATLSVPLLREGAPIGVILLRRAEAVPFTDKQIALLQTFADQAVIAIENVRLFNETKEALAHQTATAEILRVISSSPTDVQPVFDAIARSATTLCQADLSGVYPFDGELIRFGAQHGRTLEETHAARQAFPQPPSRLSVTARAILARAAVQVADVSEDREVADSLRVYRTVLSVPMMRDERPAGAITVARRVVRAFSDKHIELLQTFADQAVIAIENVRLFNELQARNQELTVALAQQTATSEILAVISGAQTDVQPVFEAIVQNARRLCDASYSSVYRVDGQLVHLVAHNHQTPEAAEAIRGAWPMPLTGDSFIVRAIRENAVVHTDMQEDPTVSAALFARGRALGHRRIVVVPMVREGQPIGALRVSRGEATPFSERHIALLQTFADQAVIAIENVRLFKELEAANRELGAASQHKSEFLANMSHELRTPLNAIIGFSEVLTERMFGELNEKQAEYLTDIHASGQHLLSLINDILDLSKIEAGRMELELTDFDLSSAIDNALTLVRERAARRGITLDKSVDERLGQMRADERKVRQVVLNLLSNAIKFTPKGGRIEVRAVPVDGSVEVSVSDTGIGIAPEDQEAVFEEFRQVGTADKKVEGTGLGLALSRKFVELHEGRIRVKSQVGVGSTFMFTLPLHPEK